MALAKSEAASAAAQTLGASSAEAAAVMWCEAQTLASSAAQKEFASGVGAGGGPPGPPGMERAGSAEGMPQAGPAPLSKRGINAAAAKADAAAAKAAAVAEVARCLRPTAGLAGRAEATAAEREAVRAAARVLAVRAADAVDAAAVAVMAAYEAQERAVAEAAMAGRAGGIGAVIALKARVEAATAAAVVARVMLERREDKANAARQAEELARFNAECTLGIAKSEAYEASKKTTKAAVAAAEAARRHWYGLEAAKTEAVRAAEKAARAAQKVQKAKKKGVRLRKTVHRLKGEVKELKRWRTDAKEELKRWRAEAKEAAAWAEEAVKSEANFRAAAAEKEAELLAARAAKTVAMAETAAMATPAAVAEEELKHKAGRPREVSAKRLDRDLSSFCAAAAEKEAELMTARAARTVAMAESAAMATRAAAAKEELKHKTDRAREVSAKRLERDLSDRGMSHDDLDEHEEADMFFQLMGKNFPEWMHQSVAAESRIGSSIHEGCQWVSYRQMEDANWDRSAAMEARYREAGLLLIEHKKASTEGELWRIGA